MNEFTRRTELFKIRLKQGGALLGPGGLSGRAKN